MRSQHVSSRLQFAGNAKEMETDRRCHLPLWLLLKRLTCVWCSVRQIELVYLHQH